MIFLGLVTLSFVFGSLKQILVRAKLSERLKQKKEELRRLEEANRQLKDRLKEVETEEFLEKEAWRLFGVSKTGEPIVSEEEKGVKKEAVDLRINPTAANYQKWWQLFIK